jgi:tRNA threonylcarbamoyladenosine biosynthesis protein TsaB
MNILALETSTEYCSVALYRDGVISGCLEKVGQKHSERLIPMLDEVLLQADLAEVLAPAGGLKLAQIDGIAYGMGPGSFTGVRIACGVVQGLALGADLKVVGICTLQALAQSSRHDRVIAALDARMAEVYFAAYEKQNGEWVALCEPCLCLPQDAPKLSGGGWHAAGSGFAAHGDALKLRYADNLSSIDCDAVPEARAIAELAAPLFAKGLGMDAAEAQPLYLRDKVALKTSERAALQSV